MRSYGQYCPIARASELLAERWSIIVLRNIVILGCRTFNEIADGAPGISRVCCRSGYGSWRGLE
jgi:DNA-binding HxlR family transcriptional regulator